MAGNGKTALIVTLSVRVTPRADRNAIAGLRDDGVLLIRTTAPPVEGAANAACLELIASQFFVRRSQVNLVSGAMSRDKRFTIDGITQEEFIQRLPNKN